MPRLTRDNTNLKKATYYGKTMDRDGTRDPEDPKKLFWTQSERDLGRFLLNRMGDPLPHEKNPRMMSDGTTPALEIGFATIQGITGIGRGRISGVIKTLEDKKLIWGEHIEGIGNRYAPHPDGPDHWLRDPEDHSRVLWDEIKPAKKKGDPPPTGVTPTPTRGETHPHRGSHPPPTGVQEYTERVDLSRTPTENRRRGDLSEFSDGEAADDKADQAGIVAPNKAVASLGNDLSEAERQEATRWMDNGADEAMAIETILARRN